MRNLCLVGERRRTVRFDNVDLPQSNNNRRHIVDMFQTVGNGGTPLVVEGSRFVLTNDGILSKISGDTGALEWVSDLGKLCSVSSQEEEGATTSSQEWLNMAYLDTSTAEEQIACISKNGAIVTVSPVTGHAELCGEFEHGLEGACWSPDRESVLLLTFEEDEDDATQKKSVLLLMNSQWEVLAETTIDSHVPTNSSNNQSSELDSSVSIAFRPDGSLCAISTVDAADNLRKIRIFKTGDSLLELHAIGRTEDGSGKLVPNMMASAGIAWAGAGCSQLLATAQRKGKKTIQIIFFEPNGLRHREFALREKAGTQVLGLAWNVESDLLAVTLREEEEEGSDKLQLWHRSNYHWYLKQELRYNKSERVVRAVFDEEKPNLLYTYFEQSLAWREYEFLWHPSHVHISHNNNNNKSCTAHAIDGSLLHTTPLDKALVPPPMYAASLDLECPIRQIVFVSDNHDNNNDDDGIAKSVTSLVHLSNGSMVLLGKSPGPFAPPPILAKGGLTSLLQDGIDPTTLRSFVVVDSGTSFLRLLCVSCDDCNSFKETLIVLTVTWDNSNQSLSMQRFGDNIPLQQSVMCVVPWADSNRGALLGLQDGSLWEFDVMEGGTSGQLIPLPADQEFIEPCPWIAGLKNVNNSVPHGGLHSHHHLQKRLIFGLSSRSRLYCRDVLLADAVSSFFVSLEHQYLCYATAQGSTSQLRFLPLKDLESFDILMGSDENHILMGFEPRSVERGARVVAILPGSPQAVLQVPRGNLEGIYPRALVLRFVMNKIGSQHYGEAFTMMRKHKVNLNLIVDLNPRKFLEEDVSLFLEQVTIIDHLNLFISCLQNWDSTNTQYRIPPWFNLEFESDVEAKKLFNFSTKVNQVCAKLRAFMIDAENIAQLQTGRSIPESHYLLPILSTFAKENPPKLEEALQLIKDNAIRSANGSKKPPLFSDVAQSSIQYLAFLADYELLFETALGMYDLEVARAVARNSQMDPRKYLPLLKHYQEMPCYFGHYEIDMRLKRYDKALRNLFESMQHEEKVDGIQSTVSTEDNGDVTSSSGNDFASCMVLISKYQLHGVGLELFQGDPTKKQTIMLSLGESLLEENKAEAALTIFLASEPVNVVKAKEAARACKNWRSFFSLSILETNGEGNGEEEQKKVASKVADEIALASENQQNGREGLGDAARILLDYCGDVDGAADMLIKGKLWQECCRVAALQERKDLVERCVEAAVSFAESTVVELEERQSTFASTMQRYDEVLEIRTEAVRGGEAVDGEAARGGQDDTGSVFSAASNASNMSLQSNMSSDSLSSVISVKTQSTFTISGAEEATRHKSKFNPMGGKNKKKKKKKSGRNRILPGSAQELTQLVGTLRSSCIDEDLCKIISETIEFLAQTSGAMQPAKELYKSYVQISEAIQKSQAAGRETRRNARLAEPHKIPITLPEEEDVEKMACPKLSDALSEVFALLHI